MDAHDDSPAMTLLRLLAEGAPASELERRSDPSPDEARELALRVRAAFDSRRRREAELTGARRDRPRPRGPARTPAASSRRSCAGPGRCWAPTSPTSPSSTPRRGDTFMRATDGSVSAEFQVVRLSLGDGLGGLVASTRKPYWSADYLHDHRFQHTGAIDSAVGDEGLVSICGTPLVVEDEFVGVLFAANRSPRPFSPDQVALLGSLAALAAVSIVQTRSAEEVAPPHRWCRAGRRGTRPVRRARAGRRRGRRHHQGARRPARRLGGAAQLRGRVA